MDQHGEATAEVQERIDDLKTRLDTYVCQYERLPYSRAPFTGPALHFHLETMRIRHSHERTDTLLQDDSYFQYLYATLTAWALHRLGRGGPKLADFDSFRAAAVSLFDKVSDLFDVTLLGVGSTQADELAQRIALLVSHSHGLTRTKRSLVVNTKAIHHFLPDLIPPIDGNYVIWFFRDNTYVSASQEADVFQEVFRNYYAIAHCGDNPHTIHDAICRGRAGSGMVTWHSSQAKVLDNAVIAYRISHKQGSRQ